MISCGSAPIKSETLNFVMVCMGCPIFEAYGQTESIGGLGMRLTGLCEGSVGYPLPGSIMELRPVAGHKARELYYNGPHRMRKYFKNEKATQETIGEDGFVKSGDLAEITEKGSLKIIGRTKCQIKLSQGEYVDPETCENVYLQARSIEQIYVEGKSLEDSLVAIVYPDFINLQRVFNGSNEEICQNENARLHVWKEMMEKAQENKLNSLGKPQRIMLISEGFTVENGLVTPTQKLKRSALLERFREDIDRLYSLPPLK